MKPISVSYKLGLAIMLIVLAILFPLGFIINRAVTDFYISTQQSELQSIGEKLASTILLSQNNKAVSQSKELISLTNYQAVIINGKGHIIENTGNLKFRLNKKDWGSLSKANSIEREWDSQNGKTYLLVAVPITKSNQLKGAIFLFSNMDNVLASVKGIRSTLYMAGLGAVLLALGFTNFLSKKLSRPLIEMEAATKEISEGNLNIRLKSTSEDELGRLAESINKMAFSLVQIQTQRKEFFANIAHELKTPVTYLSGYADVIKKGLVRSEDERQHYLSIMQEESERLSKLINDLFDLAILEEGKIVLSLERLELNNLIETISRSFKNRAKEKGIDLGVSLSNEPLWIKGDSFRMTQIFTNLLTNALRYTDQGEIMVRTFSGDKKAMIEIEDTGAGINEEDQKQIFERFFRADKSRSRQTGGTGLGLAIVKELVDLQKGKIKVKSEIGKGTKFTLTFPQEKGRAER